MYCLDNIGSAACPCCTIPSCYLCCTTVWVCFCLRQTQLYRCFIAHISCTMSAMLSLLPYHGVLPWFMCCYTVSFCFGTHLLACRLGLVLNTVLHMLMQSSTCWCSPPHPDAVMHILKQSCASYCSHAHPDAVMHILMQSCKS